MHFSFSYTLDRSQADVWRAFDSVDNMKRWQPTLVAFDRLSGIPGQPGAVSKLTYEENGRTVILTETITLRREPEEFAGRYDSAMATNAIHNRFERLGPTQTRWAITADFEFRGLWRLLTPFLRGTIAQRTRADLERFKSLLESGQL
jgi:hypothetical protein